VTILLTECIEKLDGWAISMPEQILIVIVIAVGASSHSTA